MKSTIKILGLFFTLVFILSCKKQNLPAKPQPSPFSVTVQNPATTAAAGGKVLVDIKAGSDGWWIVIPAQAVGWCTSSQLYGSGDKTITLTFAKNAAGAGRSVSVQFNPTFDLPAATINFQQQ